MWLLFQGVTYTSQVEALVSVINIESSDRNPFESWSRDQGDLRTAKINRSRRHCCNLTLNHWKSNNQAHFLTMKNFDPSCKSLKQATTSNFSLPFRQYWTTGNETIKIYRMGWSNAILGLHRSSATFHWSGFLSYPSCKQARCDCSWNNLASKHSHVIARIYWNLQNMCFLVTLLK